MNDPAGKQGPLIVLAGVARDATSINEVVQAFEQHGFTGQMSAREDGTVACLSCHQLFDPAEAEVHEFRRLEGASDPDDELAIAAIRCFRCGTLGTLILSYGGTASSADQRVLERLGPIPAPPGSAPDGG